MMVEIGPYLLIGLITVFGLALFALIGFMIYSSMNDKKAKQAISVLPREATVADDIASQYTEVVADKARVIRTGTGLATTKFKETRSAFTFKEGDAENSLSLESEFDNGPEISYLSPEEKK
jgi:hypothetical protein